MWRTPGMAVNQSENAGEAVSIRCSDGAEASGVQTGTLMDQPGSLGQHDGHSGTAQPQRPEQKSGMDENTAFRPDPGAVSRYAAGQALSAQHFRRQNSRARTMVYRFRLKHQQETAARTASASVSALPDQAAGPCKPGGLHGEIRRYPGRYLQPLLRFHGPPSGTL